MKLNNKGFAISTIMYMILIMGIVLITLTLTLLSSRKLILDRSKQDSLDNIYEEYVCKPVTIQTASYDTAGNLVGKIPTGHYTPGDEYICEVKDNTFYHFYVLSVDGNKINLILDRNVYYDEDTGTSGLVDENNTGSVAWNSNGTVTEGPVTAIEYLNNATSDWSNISNLNETYDDKNLHYSAFELTGKARLPKHLELIDDEVGCSTSSTGSCPLWLENYLSSHVAFYQKRTTIEGINGYWIMSSSSDVTAQYIVNVGLLASYPVINADYSGVRPVITVLKSDIL